MVMVLSRSLFKNQLSGTIPSSIGSLVNLQYLYVNPIPTYKQSMRSNHYQQAEHYAHILNRDLYLNYLSGTIPSSIGFLVNLSELYVNPITSTQDIHIQAMHLPTSSA